MITDGRSVQVSDSKTGEDITGRVLAQLILEQAPGKWAMLPAELLHQIIRANDSLLQEFVEKYFRRALVAFEKSQREFEQYMRQALGLSNGILAMNPAPWGTNWAGMMLGPFMRAISANGDDPLTASAAEQNDAQHNGNQVELKAELDELKHEVTEHAEGIAATVNKHSLVPFK